jgi:hypothetical protein
MMDAKLGEELALLGFDTLGIAEELNGVTTADTDTTGIAT